MSCPSSISNEGKKLFILFFSEVKKLREIIIPLSQFVNKCGKINDILFIIQYYAGIMQQKTPP